MKVQIPGSPNILGNTGEEILGALLESGFMAPQTEAVAEYAAFLEKEIAARFETKLDADSDLEGRAQAIIEALVDAGELDLLEG